MATYKEIHGVKVQYRDSDATAVEGDVWYNASTGHLKMYGAAGAWSSGGNLNTARGHGIMSTQGTQTASIYSGGSVWPSGSPLGVTESYDGSSWTEVGDLNSNRQDGGGAGTATAALHTTGSNPGGHVDNCESWNGTSWTEVSDLNAARREVGGAGIQTAAIIIGGNYAPEPRSVNTEYFDGSSWTEGANLNAAKSNIGAAGVNASAIAFAGTIGGDPYSLVTAEQYNGTAWTEVADLNSARVNVGGAGATGSAALAFGGGNDDGDPMAVVESWDDTSWTEVADLSTSRRAVHGSGTSSLALAVGGETPPSTAATEEWTFAASVETIAFD